MQEAFNIVELIENNPISKLSNEYNGKLLNKIKENFTGFEQQLFVGSFYCYLNYNNHADFVIDLDNVWKWMGFNQKVKSRLLLEKYFVLDVDYKNLAFPQGKASSVTEEQEEKWGGHNKQTIMMTINCFKLLCLKVQTKKAFEIHTYYVKLEGILQQVVEEETNELRLQLEQKDHLIAEKDLLLENKTREKHKAVEEAIVAQFPLNTECVYFGTIDNSNEAQEKLVKFGHTNNLATRIADHRNKYDNFILVAAFRVQNKVEIENLIKAHPKIKRRIRCINVNGKNKTEIIAYDNHHFKLDTLSYYIKNIIHSKTYSIENFNKLIARNEELEYNCTALSVKCATQEKVISTQLVEIQHLKERIALNQKIIASVNEEHQSVYQNVLLPEDELNKRFNEFISTSCLVRPDVEEISVNLEGRYRLWSQVKPTKEAFHALKNYLDTRFKPKRICRNHGYLGVKLLPIEYKRMYPDNTSAVELFLFQACVFSDCGKVLNSVLLKEYQKWKLSVERELCETDMQELKDYLNTSPYALKATVWTSDGNNEGYYGLSIKEHNITDTHKTTSSTGKKICKRHRETDIVLGNWDSITKAAESEGIPPTKMSRYVKNQSIIGDYYYTAING